MTNLATLTPLWFPIPVAIILLVVILYIYVLDKKENERINTDKKERNN